MQNDAADELHRVGLHAQHTPGRLPDGGKGFRQQVIQSLALGQTLLELGGFALQRFFAQGGVFSLKRQDLVHQGLDLFQFSLGTGSEKFLNKSHDFLLHTSIDRIFSLHFTHYTTPVRKFIDDFVNNFTLSSPGGQLSAN